MKFDALVAIHLVVVEGVYAGSPHRRARLDKHVVDYEPRRHPLAFVGRSTLLL